MILFYFFFLSFKIFPLKKKKKSVAVLQESKANRSILKSGLNIFKQTQFVFPLSLNQKPIPPFLKGISVALSV